MIFDLNKTDLVLRLTW